MTNRDADTTEASTRESKIDAINQVFSLFRINYHNQFYAAFPDAEQLNSAKKLWLSSLELFSERTIKSAAEHLVLNSEYLPTLSKFVIRCDQTEFSLPEAHAAYIEACHANTATQRDWSHPAVYHAGKACGWLELKSRPENIMWPIFEAHYKRLCGEIRCGSKLQLPPTTASEKQRKSVALPMAEAKKRLDAIKANI